MKVEKGRDAPKVPLPSLPVVPSHLPAALLSLPRRRPPPAACAASTVRRPAAPSPPPASPPPPPPRPALRFARRLSLLAGAPSGRAVFSLGLAATSSPSVSPPFRGESTGDASSPAKQWRCRHCSTSGRHCRVSRAPADVATTSLGSATPPSTPAAPRFRRNAVAAPASPSSSSPASFRPPIPPRRLVAPLNHHLLQHRSSAFHAVPSSAQPLLPAIIVSSSPFVLADRRPVGRLARRLAAPPPSSSSLRRVPRRPRPRAAAAGCPRRLLAGPGRRRRRRPLVVPGRRGVRPSVEPFSSVVRIRQASRCSPVLVFVLGSASSSLVPAASRLRPRIAAEAVPSPFVSVVPVCLRRARSSLSFPRLVAWW
uniref:Cell wall protein-like n=1 Tax=Oryza sativa subsp. japonica TaxID=39947 RepID=Q9AYC9_ORYSJ|nr:Hypothetical protein [Oryza sativa Japonica Group]